MIGREGPGPERPGPDYPPEWDLEPDEVEEEPLAPGDCPSCGARTLLVDTMAGPRVQPAVIGGTCVECHAEVG